MSKKGLVLVVLFGFIGCLGLSGWLVAADAPDTVEIYSSAIKKYKKGPVNLSHKKHNTEYQVTCAECHHVYEDGKNTWQESDPVQKCQECHDAKKKNKETKAAKLQNAFHKNCKDCHKENKKGPYKKCNDCHGPKK